MNRSNEIQADKPQVVVITGASAGVGRATVREFARRGAHIGLIARGQDGLNAAAREVELAGGKALAVPADIADAQAVEDAAARIEEALGPIDVWVNNAMVTIFAPFDQITPEEFRRVTEVTYLGTVHGTQAALRRMLPRDRGVIVQVGSALAYRSIPLQSAYCGAKHAIAGFTDSLRSELLHNRSRVRITAVQLPATNTPQFGWARNRMPNRPQPVAPIFEPEVAARAIVWAAGHHRRQVAVGYPTVLAHCAQKLAPGLADRYLGATGYDAQQIASEPDSGERPDNLFEPVAGDHGAHGRFSEQSCSRSPELWATEHRNWLLAGAVAGMGVLLWASRRGR
ncbi:MAG TPA: SDR family oxidoreductase [Castellaniella sp.]|nr:SDR family oxidoreductase [Castellaniella sp.]